MKSPPIHPGRLGAALIALAAAVLAGGLSACRDDAPPAAGSGPSPADKIIERAIEAMGGRARMEGIRSIFMKGTNQMPIGNFYFELWSTKPDQGLLKQMNPERFGIMTIGSDGQTTWTINPMSNGHALTEAENLPTAMAQLNLYERILHTPQEYTLREPAGEVSFGNRMCHKIRMVLADGTEHAWYFDIESGLLAGIDDSRSLPGLTVRLTRRFSNWKKFGDLNLFTKMEIDQEGGVFTEVLYADVQVNNVDPSVYALPVEVKALLAAKGGEK